MDSKRCNKLVSFMLYPIDSSAFSGSIAGRGGMAERLNAPVLKTGVG